MATASIYGPFLLLVHIPLFQLLARAYRPALAKSSPPLYEEIRMQEKIGIASGAAVCSQLSNAESFREGHRPCANILGISVDAVDMNRALSIVARHLRSGTRGYVCAIGVHGILESLRNESLADTFASSILNVPDGAPTVWIGRAQGFRSMDHVTGPALMREVFRHREFSSYSHFFYGGKPGVAEELAAVMHLNYPWIRLAGTYTPPFRDLTPDEEQALIARFNAIHPDIIWVGISTPRQELWIRRILPLLRTRLMLGVGAAFDFHTGHIRDCAPWVKRAGFQWLHRLAQDPNRLWRRNVHNMAFLWHITLQFSGLRRYPVRRGTEFELETDAAACDENAWPTAFDGRRDFNTERWPVDHMADRTCSDAEQVRAARLSRPE